MLFNTASVGAARVTFVLQRYFSLASSNCFLRETESALGSCGSLVSRYVEPVYASGRSDQIPIQIFRGR